MIKYSMILLLTIFSLSASNLEEFFNKGNEFYKAGSFDSAAVYYEKALEIGESSVLLYNRGNCAYRLGTIGEAILLYERALLLDPSNKDIEMSLAFLETQIVDKKIEVEEGFIERVFNKAQNLIPMRIQFWILFVLSLLFAVSLYFVLFRKGNRRVLFVYISGTIFLLYLIVGTSVIIKVLKSENERFAIILEEKSTVVNEPHGKKTIFQVHEGTKVAVIKASGDWMQVALENGSTGWIPKKEIGIIE